LACPSLLWPWLRRFLTAAGQLDLLKVSLPVKMFEPRSYLQKLADPWVHPRFLRLAAETEDPVARLQHVVAFFIAGGWVTRCPVGASM
jgi:hypothetical protein